MKVRCVIVDDEPLAHKVLKKYILSIDSLELVDNCYNAIEAAACLHNKKVDLLFLDIKMPGLSGMQFLKTLENPPLVIVTSAYSEYALESYEYSICDYLLKPVSFERFLKAVNKAINRIEKYPSDSKNESITKSNEFIFLKADKMTHKVQFNELIYIEGFGNYIKVYTKDKKLVVQEKMSEIEKKLPSKFFVRVHKSFIVSISFIKKIESKRLLINETYIPIGNSYKRKIDDIIATKM